MRYYSSVAGEMHLSAGISAELGTATLDSTVGLPISTPYTLVLDVGEDEEEIVTVTAVAGNTVTITRGEDGSTAQVHSVSAAVRHQVTARDHRESREHEAASLGVHGLAGAVVGTSDTQILVAKTMSGAANTFTNLPTTAFSDAAVTAAKLASNAVTTAKVLDANITKAKLAADALAFLVPTGTVFPYAGATAPTGFLLCDGTAYSRTTYAALFAVTSTQFGVGDGSTTFNVPNIKGKVVVGIDAAQTEFDARGETGGAKTHTLTVAEMPTHSHTQDPHTHTQDTNDYDFGSNPGGGGDHAALGATITTNRTDGLSLKSTTATNQNTGGNGAHNNLQPYITLHHIIKI